MQITYTFHYNIKSTIKTMPPSLEELVELKLRRERMAPALKSYSGPVTTPRSSRPLILVREAESDGSPSN
jgi:hypothetical protein